MSDPNPRMAPNPLGDTIRAFTGLLQSEVALAKAEMSQNLSRAAVGLVLVLAALLLAFTAFHLLAGAAVGYLTQAGFTPPTAALIVGGVLVVIAVILALVGKSRLTGTALAPTKTAANISRDIETLKGGLHGRP